MTAERVALEVPPEAAGARLDRFLAERIERATRSVLRRLILAGRVRVDGAPAPKPGLGLRPGMRVEVELPEPPPIEPRPEAIPLRVVHEDADLIVVDKPSGLVVHPGHGRASGTLVNALLGRGVALALAGGPVRPGIVHRLDRETSGLIVVAKTDRAHRALAAAFAERRVSKRYTALVHGRPSPPDGAIDRPIGRSSHRPTSMAVTRTRGTTRGALTRWRTLEAFAGFTLIEARPHTGRTHQIRVHLQALGHPLVGDARYGGRFARSRVAALREFGRLALHASGLEFTHPASGERVAFESPLPEEFERLLAALRAAR